MRLFHLNNLIAAWMFITILGISLAAADCPSPGQIARYNLGSQGFYWADNEDSWIGYTQGTNHNDTAIAQFNHVVWWDYENKTPTALCYYLGNQGSLILMSQGNWNRLVKKPLGESGWSPFIFEGYPAESCWADIKTCGFTYY